MTGAGLYVHVPFCRTKCGYCDFYSRAPDRPGAEIDAWVEALVTEARLRAPAFGLFATLYLGGGTPSLLNDEQLARLLAGLRRVCELDPLAEVTLEANPDDVTEARVATWRRRGITRLSLGLQATRDAELALLGRRHDAAQGWRAVERARAAGFDNLSLDLIWGLPGQSAAAWRLSLERVVDRAAPEHLSCYQLSLEPHVPLAREVAAGRLVLPGEAEGRELFDLTAEVLADRGYEHYEISNFARGRARRSRHNQLYWRHVPYLGLGPAAHAFDGERRWWNVRSVASYGAKLRAGELPTEAEERLSGEQRQLERLMLGLRTTDGVSTDDLHPYANWRQTLGALVREALVEVDGERVRPTRYGLAMADGLPLRFT